MPRTRSDHPFDHYHTRTLASVAASIALVIGVISLWPARSGTSDRPIRPIGEREAIQIEEVLQTRQTESAPPPPAPPVPLVVPNEIVLEEDFAFADGLLPVENTGDAAGTDDGSGEWDDGSGLSDEVAAAPAGPTVGPKTVRFVEPEYTREARRHRIRAELVVRVAVNDKGRVTDAEIVERFLLGKDGTSKTPVSELGYGLEEAALTAADRWMFRPARKNGVPVASETILTFTFGIDA